MRGCLRILAALMATLFVMTAVLALFAVNLIEIITDREAVKRILNAEVLVADTAPALLAETAWERNAAQARPTADQNPAVLQAAIRELLPPGWIEVQSGAVIDAMFDFLETGDPATAELEMDVRPVLSRLRGEPGRRTVQAVLELLPVCTEPQSAFDPQIGYLERDYCLPSNLPLAEVARQTYAVVVQVADQIPQSGEEAGIVHLSLLGQDTMVSAIRERLQRLQPLFLLSQRWAWLLWLIPVGCLLLILAVAVRSLDELGQWWGWPLVLTGVMALFLAILMPALLTAVMLPSITVTSDIARLFLGRLAQHLVDSLTHLWLRRVYLQAGLMLACGLFLVIVGYSKGATHR